MEARAKLLHDNIERSILWAKQNGVAYSAFLQPLFGVDNREYIGREKRYGDKNRERVSMNVRFYNFAKISGEFIPIYPTLGIEQFCLMIYLSMKLSLILMID